MQIRDLVNACVTSGLSPRMRAYEFRKKGLTFRRVRGVTTHVVNVQLSHGNTARSGGFYVNVGVAFDAITALEGTNTVAVLIGGERVHFSRRLEELEPTAPAIWQVTAGTDTTMTGERLTALLSPVLQKLDGVSSPASMLAAFPQDASVLRAQLLFLSGQRRRALDDILAVAAQFADRRGMSVDDLLKRHGLAELAELLPIT